MGSVIEYKHVGGVYHRHLVWEGKTTMDDHFLVIDEYERPSELFMKMIYCLLLNIRTGETHEVSVLRLRAGRIYKRVG